MSRIYLLQVMFDFNNYEHHYENVYPSLGILPDNFVKVDDITIVEDENGVDMPYIYKNNEFIELYIE